MKTKLISFKLNKDFIDGFLEAIYSRQYFGESDIGFILKSSNKTCLSASFNERIEKEVTHLSPFGDKVSYTSVNFHSFEFEILWSQSIIILYDAGRRVKPFFDMLSELSDFKISFEPINIDALLLYSNLEKQFKCTKINAISYKKISISERSLIDFIIQGDEDVLEHLSMFKKIDKYNLNYAKFSLCWKTYAIKICVYKKATIHLESDCPPDQLKSLLKKFLIFI